MEELAESQKRTDAHLAELAEAQKQTEARLSELAEAQKQTEAHFALASIMAELGRAQTHTENAVASLNGRFEQYISSRP
jgi:hypothetical protein